MIRLSRQARAQVASLLRHFETQERPEAIMNLRAALVRASERIRLGQGLFYDAPRPYPGLIRPGWRWTKEGSYWIAFASHGRMPIIRAVFHVSANIAERL